MKKRVKKFLLIIPILFINICNYAGGSESESRTPRSKYISPRRNGRAPVRTLSREQLLLRQDSGLQDETRHSIDDSYYSVTSSRDGSHLCTELTKKVFTTAVPFSATIVSATLLGPYSGPASSAALLTGFALSREIEINRNTSCLKSLQFTLPAIIIAAFGTFLDYYLIRFTDPFMPKKIALNTDIWQISMFFLLFQIINRFKAEQLVISPRETSPEGESRYNAPQDFTNFSKQVYKVLCVRLAKLLDQTYNPQRDTHPELHFEEFLKRAITLFSQEQLMKKLIESIARPKDTGAGSAAQPEIPLSQHEQEEQRRVTDRMATVLTHAIAKLRSDKGLVKDDGGGGGGGAPVLKSNTKLLGAAAAGIEKLTADDLRAFGVEPPVGTLARPAPVRAPSLTYLGKSRADSLSDMQHNPVPGSAQTSVATLSGLPFVISQSDSSGGSLPESKDKGPAMRLPGEVFSPSPNPDK